MNNTISLTLSEIPSSLACLLSFLLFGNVYNIALSLISLKRAEICMTANLINFRDWPQKVCLISNIVMYILTVLIIVIPYLFGITTDDYLNYFIGFCILVVMVLDAIFGGKIIYNLRKYQLLQSTKSKFRNFSVFVAIIWVIGLLLLSTLLYWNAPTPSVGTVTFQFFWRFLEAILLIMTTYFIRPPKIVYEESEVELPTVTTNSGSA